MPRNFANPRLIDVFGTDFNQSDVSFAIPRLHEDIPLYVDPFLFWISAKDEYKQLHERLIAFFRHVSQLVGSGEIDDAGMLLAHCQEPRALGLGYASGSRKGSSIGPKLIATMLLVHKLVPQLRDGQIRHIEELQLVVPKLAEDRISDVASAVLKDFFIDYTSQQSVAHGIPTRPARLGNIYDPSCKLWIPAPSANLPYNPVDDTPILLAPLDLLRKLPWINYESYVSFASAVLLSDASVKQKAKAAVLAFNAQHYVEVERFVTERERLGHNCQPDPLFKPLTPTTLHAKFKELRELPTGRVGKADQRYEALIHTLFSSLLYPTLEFAESKVRTISGAHIRDLIFYNDGKTEFWKDLKERYDARQPVFELKNVNALEPEHVSQLYRYLDQEFGRFGVLVTRKPVPDAVKRNIIDLHSSKQAVILCLDDRDVELMLSLMDSNRDPTEAIKKKFIDFTRLLPK